MRNSQTLSMSATWLHSCGFACNQCARTHSWWTLLRGCTIKLQVAHSNFCHQWKSKTQSVLRWAWQTQACSESSNTQARAWRIQLFYIWRFQMSYRLVFILSFLLSCLPEARIQSRRQYSESHHSLRLLNHQHWHR